MRTVPRVKARASVNGGNVTDAGAPGGTVIVFDSDRASVELEAHLHVVDGRRPAIDDAGRDRDALLSGEQRSLRQHGRHGEIGRLRVGNRNGSERRAFGQPKILVAHPAVALEVADHDDFARLQRRIREHALRQLQRRRVTRRFRADLGAVDGAQSRATRSAVRAHLGLRVGAEQDERGVIGRRQPLHRLTRRGLRARPPVAVSHAVGAVEQDDHFARPRRARERRDLAARRTAARTRGRSAGWRRAASPAAASRECAGGAPTDTESSRRNISDGNSTTCFRSRWVRWIRIGMASVASAAKKSGARNAIYRTRLRRCARRQILEQRVVERRRRVDAACSRRGSARTSTSAPRCAPARARGTASASAVGTTGICSPVSRS